MAILPTKGVLKSAHKYSIVCFTHCACTLKTRHGLLGRSFFCAAYYLLGQGGYVFGSVGLSVCFFLFVCGQHYLKSYEKIGMKFHGGILGSTMKN